MPETGPESGGTRRWHARRTAVVVAGRSPDGPTLAPTVWSRLVPALLAVADLRGAGPCRATANDAIVSGSYEVQALMRRFFELAHADQLRVSGAISAYLASGGEDESPIERARRERMQAVADLMAAAEHLGHAPGRKVLTSEYDAVRDELGLMGRSKLIHAFGGKWTQAQLAAMGGRPAETSAQRSVRRLWSGRARSHEDYIDGLREWLDTDSPTTTQDDYERWRLRRNAAKADQLPIVGTDAVVYGLGVRWSDAVAVAHGRLTLDAVRRGQDAPSQTLALPTGQVVVTARGAASILQRPVGSMSAGPDEQHPALPSPAVCIGAMRLWFVEEVEASLSGKTIPARSPEPLHEQLLGTDEVADRIGYRTGSFRTMVSRKDWHLVPPTLGLLGGHRVWWADHVDEWMASRPDDARPSVADDATRRTIAASDDVLKLPAGEVLLEPARAAEWLGLTIGAFRRRRRFATFPPPAVRTGQVRAWVTDDLDAWASGTRVWPERTHRLASTIVMQWELATIFDLGNTRVWVLVQDKRWDRLPKPVGHLGRHLVWLRKDVEQRLADRTTGNSDP